MELVWSNDYCLACDRQTSGGAYCSQSCRLADLESTWNTPQTSPSTSTFPSSSSNTTSPGFYLAPAIDWSSYKTQHTTTQLSYFSSTSSNQSSTNNSKTLSPSSSRSSLSSTSSTSSNSKSFSDEISSHLRDYTNSFDTTRNRRKTWS